MINTCMEVDKHVYYRLQAVYKDLEISLHFAYK